MSTNNRTRIPLFAALATLVAVIGACGGGGSTSPSGASQVVKIGSVQPYTGLYAQYGRTSLLGAQFAIDDINKNGGIKALNGAKFQLVKADAGDKPETTIAAMRSAIDEGVVATFGNDVSTLTLAGMNIAQTSKVPMLTGSFADAITQRGNPYLFDLAAPSTQQGVVSFNTIVKLAKDHGTPIKRVAFVGENSAMTTAYFAQVRKLFQATGVSVPVYEVYQAPLSDPTSILIKVTNAKPDLIVYGAQAASDSVAILKGLKQRGVNVPIIGSGSWLVDSSYLNAVGPKTVDGIMVVMGLWPLKADADMVKRYLAFSKEPFMDQLAVLDYINVYVVKAAIEQCKCTEPQKVRDAIAALDIRAPTVPANSVAGGMIKWKSDGNLVNSSPVIVQWQDGKPVTVWPDNQAAAKLRWPSN